jgi:hypothetical protein
MSLYNNVYDPITGTYITVPINTMQYPYQPNVIMNPINPNFVVPINQMHPMYPMQPMQSIQPYIVQQYPVQPLVTSPVGIFNPLFNPFNF